MDSLWVDGALRSESARVIKKGLLSLSKKEE
jgi:hypothetical protein